MTAPTSPPGCPDCGAPLTCAASCPRCGLRLHGAEAGRLWQVDVALAELDTRRAELLRERGLLLAALRQGTVVTSATVLPSPVPVPASAPPAPRPEWTPRRVQNTLLSLGVLLLTVAGIVFAAVTYDRLGAGGRAAVLLTLTAVAGLAVPRLKARGLDATAEAVFAVALALAALDAYGLRTLGLAGSSAPSLYAAGSALALAGVSGAYAGVVPVRLPRFAAVVLAHLPVPLVLAHADASAGSTGLAFAVVAGIDLAAWVGLRNTPDVRLVDVRRAVVAAGGVASWIAALASVAGAFEDGRSPGVVGLLTLAVVSTCAALAVTPGPLRLLLAALPTPLVATAAYAAAADRLTEPQQPLVLAAVSLAAMQTAALLPRSWRTGPVVGALAVTGAGLATQAEAIVQAVVLPATWLAEPWTRLAGRDARHALSADTPWNGTVVSLVLLLAAAVVVTGAGVALHRIGTVALPAGVLVVVAAVVLPLGFATSYALAIVLLLAVASALLAASATEHPFAPMALAAGTAVALLAVVWATADESATLLALPLIAVVLGAIGLRQPAWTGLSALAGGGFLAAVGAARDLAPEQVGGLLLLAPAVLVALTFRLSGLRREAVEVAALVLAATCPVLARHDPGWLSWTLAAVGLIALAEALHADRRAVAGAGALLLSASSWVRLADAQVHAPEPYVVPLAVLALLLGGLRARRDMTVRSFPAYGPGLSLLLVPSLLASLGDDGPTRGVLLLLGAGAVVLVGARQRLQAPLVVGGGVLAVDALHLLAPYAAALPRWLTLGAVGLLLVVVGATYEKRRRDLARLRTRFDALT